MLHDVSNTLDAIDPTWPREVGMILTALETGAVKNDRRQATRRLYRVTASLRLFVDEGGESLRLLYTRDVNSKSLGFITPHRLPLGYGGVVEVPDTEGRPLSIHCTILRCREVAAGWFEGALYFNRDQWAFAGT